jgi:glucose-6-phosphate 1-epimerase
MSINLGQQMQQLYGQFGSLPGITIELYKELLAVQVNNQAASATIFLQGAQLSHYQRNGEKPIIWCSDECDFKRGRSLRGGIPICWPWFGNISRNPEAVKIDIKGDHSSLAAHGLVRERLWQLHTIENLSDQKTRLTLKFALADDEDPSWPYASELQLTITVGDELTMELDVINRSSKTFNYASALHSYFSVDAIDQVSITGLDQLTYVDCMDQWSEKTQQGSLKIDQEIDRIYRGSNNTITLTEGNSNTTVQSKGSNSAIVWNPWVEKSRALSHFNDTHFEQMLCIETANAEQDYVTLAPKDKHSMALIVSKSTQTN